MKDKGVIYGIHNSIFYPSLTFNLYPSSFILNPYLWQRLILEKKLIYSTLYRG